MFIPRRTPIPLALSAAVRRGPYAAAARFTPWFTPQAVTRQNGLATFVANPLILLAEWTGLEPATPGVTGRYSNQLNYHSNTHMVRSKFQISLQALLKLGVP